MKADPKVKLPKLDEEPAPEPAKPKRRKKKDLTEEERELRLRAKETPEETKARHRAKLLEDLPDLPDLLPEPKKPRPVAEIPPGEIKLQLPPEAVQAEP